MADKQVKNNNSKSVSDSPHTVEKTLKKGVQAGQTVVNSKTVIRTTQNANKQSTNEGVVAGYGLVQNSTSIKNQNKTSEICVSEKRIDTESNPSIKTQQTVNVSSIRTPRKTEKSASPQLKHNVIKQTTIEGNSRSKERVKNKAEGHIVSEPVQESSDEADIHPNIGDFGAGVAIIGGAVAIGGALASSTAVTAIGVTAVVVGGTCCLLEGK